jgi:uncharacterized protein YecE (DUF72 family)
VPRRRDDQQPSLFPEPPARVDPATPAPDVAELGRRLPARVHLGTSSWTFPGWKGLVYGGSPTQDELVDAGLRAYAAHPVFRAVGLDRAFYRPVERRVFEQLAQQTPPGFKFLVKAYAGLTRPETDEPTPRPNPTFLDPEYARRFIIEPAREGLGDRCGPILFQFSPMDLRPLGGPAGFVAALRRFLDALPRLDDPDAGGFYAVEVRNPQVLGDAYVEALRRANAAHALNLHPTMPTPAEQARLLGPAACEPALVCRWMLRLGETYEGAKDRYFPFDRLVDPDPATRGSIATLVRTALASGRAAHVICNNKAEGSAPRSLIELAAAITRG